MAVVPGRTALSGKGTERLAGSVIVAGSCTVPGGIEGNVIPPAVDGRVKFGRDIGKGRATR